MLIKQIKRFPDPTGSKGSQDDPKGAPNGKEEKSELAILKEEFEKRLKAQQEESDKRIKELEDKLEREKKEHIEILRTVLITGKQEGHKEEIEDKEIDDDQQLYQKLYNKFLGGN